MDQQFRDRFETPFNSVMLRGRIIREPQRLPTSNPIGTRFAIEIVHIWERAPGDTGIRKQQFEVDTLDRLTLYQNIRAEDLKVGSFVLVIGSLQSFAVGRGAGQALGARPLAHCIEPGALVNSPDDEGPGGPVPART